LGVTTKSRSFEFLVGRILTLSRTGVDELICDDRVIDPDGGGRTRQVDITFKRNGSVVHVECRDHKAPQDVKWIEELIGRKISLKPDIMIGVSSSGFTPLALRKAEAHGVVLRSVKAVTENEILSWGCKVVVSVHFARMDCINFVLSSTTKLTEKEYSAFWHDSVDRRYIGSWLSSIALQFKDKAVGETLTFEAPLDLPSHYLIHPVLAKINSLAIHGFGTVVRQDFQMSSALISNEEVGVSSEDTVVFEYSKSGTELHLSEGVFRWALDFSKIRYPRDCFFSGDIRLDFGEPRSVDGVLIMGLGSTKSPEVTLPIVRQQA
jgi:Restriction endonuclease